ncbi:MAG: MFS transporter [Porticoccaceae bacterium]|nr:MFS transporter [Porticoccaceae bacterium]
MQKNIPGAYRALTMASIAFAANFSVWVLYAVLGLEVGERLELSSTELGLLLSAPIFTGALLRIPAGFLSERHSPKTLLFWQMLLVAPALFLLPLVNSYSGYIWLGLWLGISGTSFTLGVRYVTDWFGRTRQGPALGIFGAGNAGAAITLALAPLFVELWGWQSLGPAYGIGLLLMALLFVFLAPKLPAHIEVASSPQALSLAPLKQLRVWRFSLYYYFVFGSFLALILWLPTYYRQVYQLSFSQAMAFTLFFVATSSLVRALGGWFADRYGGRTVNWSVFWVCLVCLFFLSYPPTTMTIHGVKGDVNLSIEVGLWLFTGLMFVIGIAQGFGRASVYKTIHDYYPRQMGVVGGLVSAIGALGGCTLPILFGLGVDMVGIHSASFMLLYGVLAFCMTVMFFANKADRFQGRVQEALSHNFLEDD